MQTLDRKVLKPFDYSFNGIVPLTAVPDTVAKIPAHLVPGLEAAGFLEKPKGGKPALENKDQGAPQENKGGETDESRRAVEIPENWRSMEWAQMKALAASVSPTPVRSKDDVEKAIEAELKIRADLAAGNAS